VKDREVIHPDISRSLWTILDSCCLLADFTCPGRRKSPSRTRAITATHFRYATRHRIRAFIHLIVRPSLLMRVLSTKGWWTVLVGCTILCVANLRLGNNSTCSSSSSSSSFSFRAGSSFGFYQGSCANIKWILYAKWIKRLPGSYFSGFSLFCCIISSGLIKNIDSYQGVSILTKKHLESYYIYGIYIETYNNGIAFTALSKDDYHYR